MYHVTFTYSQKILGLIVTAKCSRANVRHESIYQKKVIKPLLEQGKFFIFLDASSAEFQPTSKEIKTKKKNENTCMVAMQD